jgi:phosphoribosylformylglycinamidine (FGAM) synthase PurS component
MKINKLHQLVIIFILFFCKTAIGQNPIVRDQFSADPTARVFNGKVYVYPSHDIVAKEGQGRPNWFCMEDYHVFSSSNLTDWIDHGIVVSQYNVKWVDSTGYNMWAPDCIERNGKYYFYFPAGAKGEGKKGFSIGVAVADKPEGPFIPQNEPIKGVAGIDPNVFIDKDGQAYLYWAMGKFFAAKLTANMLELASNPQEINGFPDKGLKEGPFLFERNGIYYMTYPHVQNSIERLEYATSNNPLGPFTYAGVIMDESPMNCWTNHQSVVEYNKQWFLFYHQNALSPKFDKNRSICIDSLFFNADGTIRKVTPTLRGVGITKASSKIQIDRYSSISEKGASVAFIDTTNTFEGWKTVFSEKNAWVQYNAVDFESSRVKMLTVKALSPSGATLQICLDNADGTVVAEVKIPKCTDWKLVKVSVKKHLTGVHNLVVKQLDNPVEVDWFQFAK